MAIKIQFGCDPEFILKKKDTGEIVSAEGLIGGSKDNAQPWNKFLSVLEDGVCLELNPRPLEEYNLLSYVRIVAEQLAMFRDGFLHPRNLDIHHASSAQFDKKYLGTPGTLAIGCSPDMDAYDRSGGHRPSFSPEEFGDWRFAGGHIHFGIEPWPENFPKAAFVKFVDLFLGIPMKHCLPWADPRKKFYGQAGLYREKPYGVEYRSLNNQIFVDTLNRGEGAGLDKAGFWSLIFEPLAKFVYTVAAISAGEIDIRRVGGVYKNINWEALKDYLDNSEPLGNRWNEVNDNLSIASEEFGGMGFFSTIKPVEVQQTPLLLPKSVVKVRPGKAVLHG